MAEPVRYVPRPYVREPIVSDTRTLGALLLRQGQDSGTAAAIRGATAAQMWENLARGFQQYSNATRQDAEQAATFTLREQEREANERLKRDEMAARADERKEAARVRQEGVDRQTKADAYKRGGDVAEEVGYGPMSEGQMGDVLEGPAAGRARYVFGPGTAEGPELTPTKAQQRGIEVEKAIAGMGGTVGPNGQVVMPPKPEKTTWKVEPAMVNGRRQFVRVDSEGRFFDAAGRPVDAQPIAPQGPIGGEPLEPVMGPEGFPVYAPRSKAVGQRVPTTREQVSEDERKSAGFYKQMEEAIAIMDETENQLTEKDLYQIQTLPQEALIGAANRGQMSESAKRYLRAFEQFTEARMRPVSGAAISDTEFARDRRTYARQYSETPALAKDRRAARASAKESLRARAARALPKTETPPPQKTADPLGIRK